MAVYCVAVFLLLHFTLYNRRQDWFTKVAKCDRLDANDVCTYCLTIAYHPAPYDRMSESEGASSDREDKISAERKQKLDEQKKTIWYVATRWHRINGRKMEVGKDRMVVLACSLFCARLLVFS